MSAARIREALTAYLFIAPNLLVFAVFLFLPLVLTFYVALQDKPTFGPAEFIGLENFRNLFSDDTFWRATLNTVGYALVMVPLTLGIGLGLALLLNRHMPGRSIFRSLFFLPVVISGLAIGITSKWLFNENVGVVNKIFSYVGLGPFAWQSNTWLAITTVVLISVWARTGLCMIIYLAALQSVPREQYEASAVDGATQWQQFRNITVPGVRYSTAFLAIYSIIESFQVFDLVYAATGGGPGDTTNVLGLYAYQTAFETRERGYGAAIGVVLYLCILAVSFLQWRVSKRQEA